MIQWLQGNQTPLITLNFVLSNRLGNAEQLFQKYCPGYAMLWLSQFPPACSAFLATSYSVNNSPNPRKSLPGRRRCRRNFLRFVLMQAKGGSSPNLLLSWNTPKGHIYTYLKSIKHEKTAATATCGTLCVRLQTECISSSTCYLNYTILWAVKINYVKHSLGRMGSVFLLWFCHQVPIFHACTLLTSSPTFTTQKA